MEDKKPFLARMTKTKLSEFDQAQSVGWVLERAIQIEKRIDNIIFNFIGPNNKEAFRSHILNSSVMSYGGKLKFYIELLVMKKK